MRSREQTDEKTYNNAKCPSFVGWRIMGPIKKLITIPKIVIRAYVKADWRPGDSVGPGCMGL